MRLGRNVKIYSWAKLIYPDNISLGDETVIDDFVFLYATGKGIEIGNFCHITVNCCLMAGGLIKFGDFSAIGPGGVILAQTDDYHGNGFIGLKLFGGKYRNITFGDVILGNHVHIGAGTIILPGVTIGDGCSVGAGSVITKDLPEWTICYGSPCRAMKKKPKEKQLEMEKEFLDEYKKSHYLREVVLVDTKIKQEEKDAGNKDESLDWDIDPDALRLARSPLENFYREQRLNRPSGWRDR